MEQTANTTAENNEEVIQNEELGVEDIAQTIEQTLTEELSELDKLTQEIAELKDTNLRIIADMQNSQRRAQEEIKKARDFAIANFSKEIITVKDYLEMALKDQSGNFDMLKMGVDLTLQQLVKVFDGHQVKEINPNPQEKLDANLHQAVSVIEEHEQEPNTIVAVLQKGYMLNGRVLRAAMVTVAK